MALTPEEQLWHDSKVWDSPIVPVLWCPGQSCCGDIDVVSVTCKCLITPDGLAGRKKCGPKWWVPCKTDIKFLDVLLGHLISHKKSQWSGSPSWCGAWAQGEGSVCRAQWQTETLHLAYLSPGAWCRDLTCWRSACLFWNPVHTAGGRAAAVVVPRRFPTD